MQNSLMDENLVISTPEQVSFHYETAGIGSRFVAALLDHLIIGVVLLLIYVAASALSLLAVVQGLAGGSGDGGSAGIYLVVAFLVLITFLIVFGYFLMFEIVWKGQTPGKRLNKLRVLKRNGEPIGAGEAIIRNLVRLVDLMPGFYAIGLITMFIDKDARRMGDFAAGTLVVREGEQVSLGSVRVAPQAQNIYEEPPVYSGQVYAPDTSPPATASFDPLPGVSLRNVTPEDYRLVREVLERARRGEMQGDRAAQLADRLAYGIAQRMGYDFNDWKRNGWNAMLFLESVLNAREVRGS